MKGEDTGEEGRWRSQSYRREGRVRSINALRTAATNDYWLILCVCVCVCHSQV